MKHDLEFIFKEIFEGVEGGEGMGPKVGFVLLFMVAEKSF